LCTSHPADCQDKQKNSRNDPADGGLPATAEDSECGKYHRACGKTPQQGIAWAKTPPKPGDAKAKQRDEKKNVCGQHD
jgi:hypothetical protein